jgi:hypothetical protein
MFFPPNSFGEAQWGASNLMVRLSGVNFVGLIFVSFLLSRYGVRGIFSISRPWYLALFLASAVTSLFGGFRSGLIALVLGFSLQFYMEGLHRTKLLPIFILALSLGVAVALPFVRQMPYVVQRSLSFLPIEVDPIARLDAEGSTEWRLKIWEAVLPQVPKYFFLGKGLAMSQDDYDFSLSTFTGTMQETSADESWAALAGDYHNGPLSVIIPFGIWGVIGFIWFLAAAWKLLYRNFKYGDPSLHIINVFMFSAFVVKVVMFFVIFGGFYSDMQWFVGYVGMSVCLNNGIAKPAPETLPQAAATNGMSSLIPRTRPALGRSPVV